jgi:hypothetical protein
MPPREIRAPLFLAALLAAVATAASANGGRIELGHERALAGVPEIGDAPGYPVTIRVAGAYVLTSALTPPAKTSAITVRARDVEIDLNGHAIRGSFACASGACSVGTGSGIETAPGDGGGTTVRDGVVRGFGTDCVQVGEGSRVARLHVADCGEDGIEVGPGSEVRESTIQRAGRHGVFVERGAAAIADNTIFDTARGDALGAAVSGGVALGGNLCASGHCSPRGARRYYLTSDSVLGDAVLAACAEGFHPASALELRDPSALEYAPHLGRSDADSGRGPVSAQSGWVRTGQASSTAENCSAFTSASNLEDGRVIRLLPPQSWGTAAATQLSPWQANATNACNAQRPVWCIED